MKVAPLNQFRELQILWLFPARSSHTGTAGTGIEILGSFSARPLGPIDLRTMRLNYFLQDLFRDTTFDHIWSTQVPNLLDRQTDNVGY